MPYQTSYVQRPRSGKDLLISPLLSFIVTVVDGNYTEWSGWSPCSSSCGGGTHVATRECTNPHPSFLGKDCQRLGDARKEEICNDFQCPGEWENFKLILLPTRLCKINYFTNFLAFFTYYDAWNHYFCLKRTILTPLKFKALDLVPKILKSSRDPHFLYNRNANHLMQKSTVKSFFDSIKLDGQTDF